MFLLRNEIERVAGTALTVAGLFATLLVSAAPLSAQSESCIDSGMKTIRRLGASAVSSSRIDTREAMLSYFESIRPDIERIMERKGLSDRTEELFAALRSGDGVSEGQLHRGDVIEWMIFRQNGNVGVGRGPYCLDIAQTYDTLEVKLVDEVDQGATTQRTTTTFLIPKICANLALGSVETESVEKPPAAEPAPAPPPASSSSSTTESAPPQPPPPPPATPDPADDADAMDAAPSASRGGWDGSRWTLRGFPLTIDVDDDEQRTDSGDRRTEFAFTGGSGLGANLEYRKSPRLGLEGGLLYAELDSFFMFDSPTEWLMDDDESSFLALTFGPNFHLTPDQRADFYIGPFIGLAEFGEASYSLNGNELTSARRDFDSEFIFGLQLGLDIPFGESDWALHVGGLYMDLSTSSGPEDIDLNPLIGTIGLAYDF